MPNRDLQIIGDRIEFMGYHVGDIRDMPSKVRERFVSAITETDKPVWLGKRKVKSK